MLRVRSMGPRSYHPPKLRPDWEYGDFIRGNGKKIETTILAFKSLELGRYGDMYG